MFIINECNDEVIEFEAQILHKIYYNNDTSWGVYNFTADTNIPHLYRNNINVPCGKLVGKMQELTEGCNYLVRASYQNDSKYGGQYVPVAVFAVAPKSREQQLIFLQSLISEQIANNIIDVYPDIVNDVIDGRIDTIDYSKVRGVGKKTWDKIKQKIIDNYLISDIIALLQPIGVTYTMIKKLLEDQPNPTLLKQDILDNPYVLTRVHGLGFKKVDELALSLKPELKRSMHRLSSFTLYYFRELGETDGHTWVSDEVFRNAVSNTIPECNEFVDKIYGNNKILYVDEGRVGLNKYHDVELDILNRLRLKNEIGTDIKISEEIIKEAISKAEKEQGFTYVKEQIETIYNVLNNPVSLIFGKAGTGKSSIMRAIINAYTISNLNVAACALSAMAAQRVTEATDFPAMTIHRTLGCKGLNKFSFNENMPLIADVVIMDEGSMTNAHLFLRWLKAIGSNTRIIISGDHKQLPPIGYGNTFSDILNKLPENCINALTKPMRQAVMSGILSDANLIRENHNPVIEGFKAHLVHGELQDMHYMFRDNRNSLFDIAIKTYMKSISEIGIDNVVIAVPRKQGCLNSTMEYNKKIQDLLLPDETRIIKTPKITLKHGAKVMQTVNDYARDIFNGDIGYITDIYTVNDDGVSKPACSVTFRLGTGQNKVVEYIGKEVAQLDLAYTMTVHKLQGSGKHTVIGVIDNTHFKLLDNCMLYTMLTRAKKRCLLLAEPEAFNICMRTSHNRRNTWLSLKERETD